MKSIKPAYFLSSFIPVLLIDDIKHVVSALVFLKKTALSILNFLNLCLDGALRLLFKILKMPLKFFERFFILIRSVLPKIKHIIVPATSVTESLTLIYIHVYLMGGSLYSTYLSVVLLFLHAARVFNNEKGISSYFLLKNPFEQYVKMFDNSVSRFKCILSLIIKLFADTYVSNPVISNVFKPAYALTIMSSYRMISPYVSCKISQKLMSYYEDSVVSNINVK